MRRPQRERIPKRSVSRYLDILHGSGTVAVKKALKRILPSLVLVPLQSRRIRKEHRKRFAELSTRQIFTKIYKDGLWHHIDVDSSTFYSGLGSHDSQLVEPYVAAVTELLAKIAFNEGRKPDAVDLGCGDFNVGSRIRPHCRRYTACDIVEPLINFNRQKYVNLDVDFLTLDISTDPIPGGDVVFIRQVLQHLANERISIALAHLVSKFKYILVTEHIPSLERFRPNIDKPSGPDIRLRLNSGVVLTAPPPPPFNLKAKHKAVVCEARKEDSIIRTELYTIS